MNDTPFQNESRLERIAKNALLTLSTRAIVLLLGASFSIFGPMFITRFLASLDSLTTSQEMATRTLAVLDEKIEGQKRDSSSALQRHIAEDKLRFEPLQSELADHEQRLRATEHAISPTTR